MLMHDHKKLKADQKIFVWVFVRNECGQLTELSPISYV